MLLVLLIVIVILFASGSTFYGETRYVPGSAGIIGMMFLIILLFLVFNLIGITP